MKDWDKGTLTEKERGDLAKAQDIEEKLQLTKYLSPQENQGLKDAISLKFDGIALPSTLNFDNLGKNNKEVIARETTEKLEKQLEADIKTILTSGTDPQTKQDLLDKYGFVQSDLSGLSTSGSSIANFIQSDKGQTTLINKYKDSSEADNLLINILGNNSLNNQQKVNEINKEFGVSLSVNDLSDMESAKNKVYGGMDLERFISKDTDKIATQSRDNSAFVQKFIEKAGLLTNLNLGFDNDDFVTYSTVAGRSYNKQGDKLIKQIIDKENIVQLEMGTSYTEKGKIIDGIQGSVITVKNVFDDHEYMKQVGMVTIDGVKLSISDGTLITKGGEAALDHELIHSLNTITGQTDKSPGIYMVVKERSLAPGETYTKSDIVIGLHDTLKMSLTGFLEMPLMYS